MKLDHIMPGLLLMVTTLALDQWSKWFVLFSLRLGDRPPMEIAPFFNLVLVWNRGISFGMLAGRNQPMLLIVVSVLVLVTLLAWLMKTPSKPTVLALGAIMGGALGNITDRFRFGAVIDFLDFHLADWHWPAFNVADSAIFIGVVVLCALSMVVERKGN